MGLMAELNEMKRLESKERSKSAAKPNDKFFVAIFPNDRPELTMRWLCEFDEGVPVVVHNQFVAKGSPLNVSEMVCVEHHFGEYCEYCHRTNEKGEANPVPSSKYVTWPVVVYGSGDKWNQIQAFWFKWADSSKSTYKKLFTDLLKIAEKRSLKTVDITIEKQSEREAGSAFTTVNFIVDRGDPEPLSIAVEGFEYEYTEQYRKNFIRRIADSRIAVVKFWEERNAQQNGNGARSVPVPAKNPGQVSVNVEKDNSYNDQNAIREALKNKANGSNGHQTVAAPTAVLNPDDDVVAMLDDID